MNYFWNVFASYGNFELLALLALAALKTTLLLGFVYVFCLFFRRFTTAAALHLLWTSVLCASLLLPFLSFAEVFELPILPAQPSLQTATFASNDSIESDDYSEITGAGMSSELTNSLETGSAGLKKIETQSPVVFSQDVSPIPEKSKTEIRTPISPTSFLTQVSNMALAIWIAGMLLFLTRLLIGFAATNSLVRRASPFKESEINEVFSALLSELKLKSSVRLRASENSLMPMVCGIFRPIILLPREAATSWSNERLRIVLLHELAHVARHDCLTQLPARLACIFYWFNPLVWAVERRARIEREQASDDYVLSVGTKPSEYAHHLLEIARSMQQRSIFEWSQTTSSVAMARRSQLEGRLLAILSRESKSRSALSGAAATLLIASLCILFVSLTIVKPTAIAAQKAIASSAPFNNKKNTADVSLFDSFLLLGQKHKNDSVIARSENKETTRKQNDTASLRDIERLQSDNEQTKNSGKENTDSSAEINLKQNVSETLQEKIVADAVPTPTNIARSSGIEPSSFINAAYRQESPNPVQTESVDFIEEMASVGYTNLTIDDLVRLKQANVTADYVRSLRSLGFVNLTVKELAAMGIHGVTPNYIQAIRAAGYVDLSAKDITAFRIHNISPEFIKSLRDAGYGNLNAKQIKDFAVHRITPNFISGIRAVGFSNLSPKELVSLRVYDITPEFIRQARSRLGELNLKQIITLKITGVLEDDKGKDKDND